MRTSRNSSPSARRDNPRLTATLDVTRSSSPSTVTPDVFASRVPSSFSKGGLGVLREESRNSAETLTVGVVRGLSVVCRFGYQNRHRCGFLDAFRCDRL